MPRLSGIVLFLIALSPPVGYLQAQNLVPNPDFELYTVCPTGYHTPGQNPPYPAPPWESTTWGSSDYFHICSNPSEVGIPDNDPGWQPALSGDAYAGLYVKSFQVSDYREYLTAPLNSSLIGGKYYYVAFYVSLANTRCGIQRIGAYMSADRPPYVWGEFPPLEQYTPQVESGGAYLSDTLNWMLIEGCFRAVGGEAWVTIGNFHNNNNTPLDPDCTSTFTGSYYYIEDVYIGDVVPGGIDVDLGDDVTTCYSTTLEAGITGVDYYWSTGSTESSITVDVPGMYYLTVYDGCDAGVDSVEVFITDSPPVQLPPDYIICPGESVDVSLDPDEGDYVWNDGSTESAYSITTTGTFVVTLDDGCDITSDNIQVTILPPPPPFSLGGDTLLCTGGVIEYDFDPDIGDFMWSNGSQSNSFSITGTGAYGLTITNMCGEEEAEVIVDQIDPEVVMLPISADTLCNGESLAIALDSTSGTFIWQDGSTDDDYVITAPGLYSVTMSHYCGSSADSVLVMAMNTPVVNLGDTLSPCPGDTLILSVIGATGTYTWQDGSANDSLWVTVSGTYMLQIENACGMDSDQVVVLYEEILLSPDLGPDFSLCPGEEAVLTAGNLQANIVWQDLSTADTFLVTTAGTYTVTISNTCYSSSDTVIVSVENEPPSILLPDQITLCQGITDTLQPGVTGVEYNWSDGSQNPTLTIASPGMYSLTVSNACGTDTDTIQVLDGGPLPSVSLGADTSMCPGTTWLLTPTYNAVDTWTWPDGSGASTYAIHDSVSIVVMVQNTCGQVTDTIHVGLLEDTPYFDLGSDTSICPGESIILSISNPNISIQWSDGTTGPNLLVNDPGTYYASVSNACGISADTIVVDSFPGIPLLDLGPDIPLCPGEQFTLHPGIPDVAYLWQDGSVNTSFLVDEAGTIILTILNACGTSTDELTVYTSTNAPDVDLGEDILQCEGSVVTLMSNIAGVNFLWQDGTTGASYTTSTAGIFYLQVSNACGTDTDTVVVDIHGMPPVSALGPDTMLCEGSSLTLLANEDGETDIVWQDGSSEPTFLVTDSGIYVLHQTNLCGEHTDSITVDYQSLPADVELGPDTVLCEGATLLLTAPTIDDLFTWQDGSTGLTYSASKEGVYTLTVINECGSTSDQLLLTYDDRIPQFSLEDTIALCPGNPVILDVTQPFNATYAWSTGSLLPVITVHTPGVYAVTVSTECLEVSADITIHAKNDCDGKFYIPNIISPNGDNINDVFTLFPNDKVEIISIEGAVFDRWGNQLYHSNAIHFTWEGKAGDEDVNPGSYVYILRVRYRIDGVEVEEQFAGDVTVVR